MSRIIWLCLIASITLCNCNKSDGPILSNEKKVLSLTANGSQVPYQIDEARNRIDIQLPSHTFNIKNMGLQLELSPGATIPFGYTNFTIPQVYTIVAEDGTQRQYTVIVSQVNMRWLSSSLIEEELSVSASSCTQTFPNLFRLNLGCGPTDSQTGAFKNFINLDFLDETQTSLYLGNWGVGPSFPNFMVNVSFGKNNGSSLSLYENPADGIASVTQLDYTNVVLSGTLSSVKYYAFQQPSGDYYLLYGEFYNIPFN